LHLPEVVMMMMMLMMENAFIFNLSIIPLRSATGELIIYFHIFFICSIS
jgi:hypothetical protein